MLSNGVTRRRPWMENDVIQNEHVCEGHGGGADGTDMQQGTGSVRQQDGWKRPQVDGTFEDIWRT